jgi:maltose O-acetyltransferase
MFAEQSMNNVEREAGCENLGDVVAGRVLTESDVIYLRDSGQIYDAEHPALSSKGSDTKNLLARFNALSSADSESRQLIPQIFTNADPSIHIEPPFMCASGANIKAGENVRIGTLVDLGDNTTITIGKNSIIGAAVSMPTIVHPNDAVQRIGHAVKALPITIGENVIIGARSTVMPGVTIGDNVWVTSGSVVTKDVPSNSLVSGAPGRVLRSLTASEVLQRESAFRKLEGGIIDEPVFIPFKAQPASTAAALADFNQAQFATMQERVEAVAKIMTSIDTSTQEVWVFQPFEVENGANIHFQGPWAFINNGNRFHDGDPALPITVGAAVFFGPKSDICGGVTIGDGVWIGANCTVGEAATIGERTIVAANTVIPPGTVVPSDSIVVGNPCRVMRSIGEEDKWPLDPNFQIEVLRRSAARGFTED